MVKVLLENVAQERRENIKTSKDNFPVVGLEHITPMQIQLTDWSTDKDNTFTKVFKKGDILFGRRRAYLKKAALAPFDGICSGDITVISPIAEKIEPTLLPFIIQNDDFFDFAVEKSAGSLSPRVKWEHLKTYSFELPSMEKQRELAQILWAAEETKQFYKSLLQKTDDLVKAKFEEMFGTYQNPKFSMERIGNLGNIITGNTPSMRVNDYYNNKDIQFIKPTDLQDNVIIFINSSDYYISNKAKDIARIFPKNSVLVSCIGTIGKIGINKHEASCNQQINVIIPNSTVNYLYLAYCLSLMKDVFIAKAKAPVVPILNKKDFSNINAINPPIELQQTFSVFVQQAEKSKQKLQKSLEQLNATTKALINENLK